MSERIHCDICDTVKSGDNEIWYSLSIKKTAINQGSYYKPVNNIDICESCMESVLTDPLIIFDPEYIPPNQNA